jgi:hypothetical protein
LRLYTVEAVYSKFLLSSLLVSIGFAASPAIGIISASGHFTVERSAVWGNSTLFEGATVQTDQASSEVALRNGVRVQLAAGSRAQVWENRVLLERGTGQVVAPGAYEVDAAGLKIQAVGARLRIGITDRVEVTALTGTGRVTTAAGFLLAAIPAGRSMSFSMQAGATGVASRTGCLLFKDGHFILQDENTQEVAELYGSGLLQGGKELRDGLGSRVEVTGTPTGAKPAVSIATIVINAAGVSQKSQGGCLSVASMLDAKTEAPAGAGKAAAGDVAPGPRTAAGTHTGLSTGAIVGIVAVAGGGAGAALALAHSKGSTSP